jgi:hypothetical protein
MIETFTVAAVPGCRGTGAKGSSSAVAAAVVVGAAVVGVVVEAAVVVGAPVVGAAVVGAAVAGSAAAARGAAANRAASTTPAVAIDVRARFIVVLPPARSIPGAQRRACARTSDRITEAGVEAFIPRVAPSRDAASPLTVWVR